MILKQKLKQYQKSFLKGLDCDLESLQQCRDLILKRKNDPKNQEEFLSTEEIKAKAETSNVAVAKSNHETHTTMNKTTSYTSKVTPQTLMTPSNPMISVMGITNATHRGMNASINIFQKPFVPNDS